MWRVVIGALCVALAGSSARGLDVQQVVRRVQARYDATRDFTADVTQELIIASLGKTTSAHGTVAFKKPGKMRWDLRDGEPEVIVADGTTLWLYEPKEHQVLKSAYNAAFRSTTPISFLTGVGRIAQDFTASLDGTGTTADGAVLYLKLVPRRKSAELGQLRLTVTRKSFDIVGAEIRDPLGNVSRVRFAHIERNKGIPNARFVFTVPAGADVITAPGAQ